MVFGVIAGLAVMTINSHVVSKGKNNIAYAVTDTKDSFLGGETDRMKELDADCIIVLGAGIVDNETPTPMLKDRLDAGILLYNLGVAPKVLLTGDNGQDYHNEIRVMLSYLLDAGIPSEDIFCDHAGFSTYDSMYRAQDIFDVKKAIVVTQTYHLYRALYIGESLGMTVMGIGSDQERYSGQSMREVREVLARVKDFFKSKTKPKSVLGGEAIPINGSGIISHGE